ncbi:MAG: lipopolysaccharide assembly protein LapA domain-containing protein [Legionellales bacterium]|jgi:putative membrane protein
MRLLSSLFLIVLIILAISFALLNAEIVNVNYFFAKAQLPLSLLLLIALCVGCLLGFLAQVKVAITQRYRNHVLTKKNNLLNQELNNLRAMPVKDHL